MANQEILNFIGKHAENFIETNNKTGEITVNIGGLLEKFQEDNLKRIEDLKTEVKTKDELIDYLRDEVSDKENEVYELEDAKDELISPENLQDELKHQIVKRIYHNLSLNELEELEKALKETMAEERRNYIIDL